MWLPSFPSCRIKHVSEGLCCIFDWEQARSVVSPKTNCSANEESRSSRHFYVENHMQSSSDEPQLLIWLILLLSFTRTITETDRYEEPLSCWRQNRIDYICLQLCLSLRNRNNATGNRIVYKYIYCLQYFAIRLWVKQSLCACAKFHVWCARECPHVFLSPGIHRNLSELLWFVLSLEVTLISAPHKRIPLFHFTKFSNIAKQRRSHMTRAKKTFSNRNKNSSSPSSTSLKRGRLCNVYLSFLHPSCAHESS